MFELKWLSEIILLIYGSSLFGYFIDFIQNNQKANRIAFWLLSMVWFIQTLVFVIYIFYEKSFPVATLNDSLFFYSWILVTLSLVINRLFTIDFIVFFINLFGFFLLLFYLLTEAQNQMPGNGIELVHEILIAHIVLAVLSYGFFTVSYIFSFMYVIQYRFLKNKKGLKWMWRLGDLKRLDTYSFTSVTLGVPLLLISIILGVVWAYVTESEFYWFDVKTAGSILVLFVYIGYLLLKLVKGYQGKGLAVYNTAAFLILLVNFFLFSVLSNFHF
ncbi:cytochrome C assembly family protein [Virgibacillus sediminis]|uniref:Inner membrane protein YpjD n=1 Tax=Virgibacillus sediminis TaxID=202260 RepID=A0ABV7A6Q2_9BACI